MWVLQHFSEVDAKSIKSYECVTGITADKNIGDLQTVDINRINTCDIIFCGLPCQDYSSAGKQQGNTWECAACGNTYNPLDVAIQQRETCPKCCSANINKTRSSLVIKMLDIVRKIKPKLLIYENVANLVSKKFKPDFEKIVDEIKKTGYNCYWSVLNAKDYGVPQNRKRLYLVAIRQDIDTGLFCFPTGHDVGKRLKDVLEPEENLNDKQYVDRKVLPRVLGRNTKDKAIRRLTVRECWRLFGYDDATIDNVIQLKIPSSYLYQQIGNSVVVDVLYYIYCNVYKVLPQIFEKPTVISLCSGIGGFEYALNKFYESKQQNNWKDLSAKSCETQSNTQTYRLIQIGNIYKSGQNGKVYDTMGICPTITSGGNGYIKGKRSVGIGSTNAPKIVVKREQSK